MQMHRKALLARARRLTPAVLRRIRRGRGSARVGSSERAPQVLPYLADFKRQWRLSDYRFAPRRRFWRRRR
jgi:hypothetical protein